MKPIKEGFPVVFGWLKLKVLEKIDFRRISKHALSSSERGKKFFRLVTAMATSVRMEASVGLRGIRLTIYIVGQRAAFEASMRKRPSAGNQSKTSAFEGRRLYHLSSFDVERLFLCPISWLKLIK